MALNIKDARTDRLARELAELTGESITEAARTAIEERLRRVRAAAAARESGVSLRSFIEWGRAQQVLDLRSDDEILGYDEHGMPS